MTVDPFRNDHQLQRRARSRGDGFVLRSFQFLSQLLLGVICFVVIVPLLFLAFRALTAREPAPANVPGEIRNVHSLGINPKDGRLYAATTRGLYLVTGLHEAERIAESYQENSAFTVVGPDQFISSGRPDIRDLVSDFEPAMMGFQRSNDGGHKWSSISLKGKATFSHLQVSSGLIYGYEASSAVVMVSSDDGRTWEPRSTLPSLLDFAVSPTDLRSLLALTPEGALASKDGGATWHALTASGLVFIEWHRELWSIDEGGNMMRSEDEGLSWQALGTLPEPADAFLATPDGLYIAVRNSGIFMSADHGRTWTPIYLLPEPS